MDENRIDEVPMLLDSQLQQSDDCYDSRLRNFASRMRREAMSIPSNSMDSNEDIPNLVGHTGPLRSERKTSFFPMSGPLLPNCGAAARKIVTHPTEKFPSFTIKDQNDWPDDEYARKNQHLLRSGQLGMCNDPYCTTCPSYYISKTSQQKNSKSSVFDNYKFYSSLNGDAKGWAKRLFSYLRCLLPGVMNPHTKLVQQWNKLFVISCFVAVFVDPLFFFCLSVEKENKCIVLDWAVTIIVVVLRTMTDFIYIVHILLQFRLAYIAPESRVVIAAEFVDHPKKIALHYIRGYFFFDLFIAFPLPQLMILLVVPQLKGSSAANYAKCLFNASVLIQYFPRLYKIWPMLAGQSSSVIFESAWANVVMNLLTFVLSGHVVGSFWYLFGLQRVNQCLRNACHHFNTCQFKDCGYGDKIEIFYLKMNETWNEWKTYPDAVDCFSKDSRLDFGIYEKAINLTTEHHNIITRYVYSLFWGFQQVSTLAGNLTPSYYAWEVLFIMCIIGMGLLLFFCFAQLIGNMQNFLQSLGQRRMDMSLRRRNVEQWMSHRRLPEELRRKVREAERYNWAVTRGVNEEVLLENLPEDLQREIRRHLCKFVKKVRMLALMEDPLLDAICERLRQKTYIKGSKIMCPGNLVEKMVFVVRGMLESNGEDGFVYLSEGDVCGEELFTWCIENYLVNKEGKRIRLPGHRLLSGRTVKCLTNVEAFVLREADLEEVTSLFARVLCSPRGQGVVRYVSPYWRGLAATRIQVAWRYRKQRLSRADTSQSHHPFK